MVTRITKVIATEIAICRAAELKRKKEIWMNEIYSFKKNVIFPPAAVAAF